MKRLQLLLFSTVLLCTYGWTGNIAGDSSYSTSNEPKKEFPEATNLPANPWADDSNLLWVEAEALLWQAFEDNLPVAMTAPNLPPIASTPIQRDVRNPHFDWNWGYRVGVGYEMPHDGWDGKLIYTRMKNHAKRKIHGVDFNDPEGKHQFIFQYWGQADFPTPDNIVFARGSWSIDLDQFDLNLGREYYVGKHLTVRPNGGLRTTWLFQRYDVLYENQFDTKQKIAMKDRFWGFGFVGGVDLDWIFGAGFSLYGGADYSILLGFFDIDQHAHQLGSEIWKNDKSFRTGRSIIDMELGIKWARLVSNNQLGFTIKAGYEYHLYLQQNQFLTYYGQAGTNSRFKSNEGNLIYQGVSLTGMIHF
ncbi:MAG: hypothetical protein KF898_01165 [Parachlamydiales bacterium]|nr:hypothetical protein [Verrucomicrobiota bacterium]MBX3718239.1 hypothetical protein [Candidatus Acheromyda pituitae]